MAKKGGAPENLDLKLSTEEARKRGHKGGIASGKARAKQKSIREALQRILKGTYEVDGDMLIGTDALALAAFKAALDGNIQAFKEIRDTVGEKPTDKVEMDTEIKVVFGVPRPEKGKRDGN